MGKTVTVTENDLEVPFSQKNEKSFTSAVQKQSFSVKRFSRTPSVRRSTFTKPRAVSTRIGFIGQRKWRTLQRALTSMKPPYKGRKDLCYLNLLLQFLFTFFDHWWAKRQLSTRIVRKMVVCQIIGLIVMGFLFSTGGVFNISVTSKSTNEYTRDFYWAMTIVSLVVFSLSVVGCIGVFRPNMFITQIYAVVSFIFGHLIFSVVLGWYLLVILDAYLSDKYFHHPHNLTGASADGHYVLHPIPHNVEQETSTEETTTEISRILNYRSDEQIFKDKLLRQYCLMLLFASMIMMSSGVLTTKLLIQVRRKQGYLYIETTQRTSKTLQPSPSQTRDNDNVV